MKMQRSGQLFGNSTSKYKNNKRIIAIGIIIKKASGDTKDMQREKKKDFIMIEKEVKVLYKQEKYQVLKGYIHKTKKYMSKRVKQHK